MEIATIGFTQTSAEHFFERLRAAHIARIIDIRVHNSSQLAGFAKGDDLAYFARVIGGMAYEHDLRLAPVADMKTAYRRGGLSWSAFERAMRDLLHSRGVPGVLDRERFERSKTVLLCSEPSAEHCHRRIVAELLAAEWGASVQHL
ncbi:MAG: DUF488 domain-containing protein [Chloroflexi bacterium]|nr:DUF488 domain-containing protein [Chloroflexota bacterium]